MICKICIKIMGMSNLAKNNNLWKHQGRKATKSHGDGVPIGEKYIEYNFTHLENDRFFASNPIGIVVAQMVENTIRDRKTKWIQFAMLLHLLQRG